eukprot:1157367-Pelagomonas_calceolata.AAC.4
MQGHEDELGAWRHLLVHSHVHLFAMSCADAYNCAHMEAYAIVYAFILKPCVNTHTHTHTHLSDHRGVLGLHHGVDDGLGVHHNLNVVVLRAKEVVGLDDLQTCHTAHMQRMSA